MCLGYNKLMLPENEGTTGTGWLPPLPDLRDYTETSSDIPKLAAKLGVSAKTTLSLPSAIDWRKFCSPIENQLNLGSCTAHAAVGVIEYFQRRAYSNNIEGSRLFIYKTTRNLMGVTGDTGAWLRNTMGALVLCGVAPEKYWPYIVADYDKDPTPFVYAVADNYEALKYFCHDPLVQNNPRNQVLTRVKTFLAAGIPSMFGFFGFDSFSNADIPGGIPYPCPGEQSRWGHAIVAVGYDDNKKITNTLCNKKTKGALLIRNSWGPDWGDNGYGWLPYDYILSGYALDFWSLFSMEWVDTKQFGV
jgi:C1A family cysteine protease